MPIRSSLPLTIAPADKAIIEKFYGTTSYWRREIREIFYAAAGDQIVAVAGIWRDPRTFGSIFDEEVGRWLAFLDAKPEARAHGVRIVKALAARLSHFEDELYIHHDDRFPEAARMLRLLKFKPTDEFTPSPYKPGEKLRVWKRWQIQSRS